MHDFLYLQFRWPTMIMTHAWRASVHAHNQIPAGCCYGWVGKKNTKESKSNQCPAVPVQ